MSFFRRVGNLIKGQIAEKRKNHRNDPEVEEELSRLTTSTSTQEHKPVVTETSVEEEAEQVEDFDQAGPSKTKRTL